MAEVPAEVTADQATTNAELAKGRITALIDIQPTQNPSQPYQIQLTSSAAANPQNIQLIKSILNAVIANINATQFKDAPTIAVVKNEVIEVPGRTYRTIDFILPGQLGFSLLSAGVFGVAFLFFNLRQQLVLKRFFATPIRKGYILFGEGISRVLFQLITAIVILLIGRFVFGFTLVHGVVNFL